MNSDNETYFMFLAHVIPNQIKYQYILKDKSQENMMYTTFIKFIHSFIIHL